MICVLGCSKHQQESLCDEVLEVLLPSITGCRHGTQILMKIVGFVIDLVVTQLVYMSGFGCSVVSSYNRETLVSYHLC